MLHQLIAGSPPPLVRWHWLERIRDLLLFFPVHLAGTAGPKTSACVSCASSPPPRHMNGTRFTVQNVAGFENSPGRDR
jgi:hypothetical protein